MTPDEYERLVADIAAGILEGAPELGDLALGYGRRNKICGQSTYSHQIDVSLAGPSRLYLIECKRWDHKIGVEEVMVLAARGSDILQANSSRRVNAILVTKIGATKGARTLAEHFGIEIEIVLSAKQFGFKIGERAVQAVADSVGFRDSADATVMKRDGGA